MDNISGSNFQSIFNQSTLDLDATSITIGGLTSGVIGVNSSGNLTSNVTTDDLDEGKTNLYYTDARVLNTIGAYTFPAINADVITAGTGYIANITGTNGSFQIVRCDRMANLSNDNLYLEGVRSGEKLISVPDSYPNTPFPNDINEKDISIGWRAGNVALTQDEAKTRNICIGHRSGLNTSNTLQPSDNILIGQEAGFSLSQSSQSSVQNVMIGNFSGQFNKGYGNIYIGHQSAAWNQDQTGSIMIGYQAGNTITQSHRLAIHNNGADPNPLILGEFDTRRLYVHNSIIAPTGMFSNGFTGATGYARRMGCESLTGWTGFFQRIQVADSVTLPITGILNNNSINWSSADGFNVLSISRGNGTESSVGIGYRSKQFDPVSTVGQRNVSIGWNNLASVTSGYENSSIGHNCAGSISVGFQNLAFGSSSLNSLTGASQNCGFGMSAGLSHGSGNGSCYFGTACGRRDNNVYTNLQENVCMGESTFQPTANIQAQNTMLGAKISAVSGLGNVCIGYASAQGQGVGDNRLFIHNKAPTSLARALIEGNFDPAQRQLRLNSNKVQYGYESGLNNQATYGVGIGFQSAMWNQGANSIAIGYQAGFTGQREGSIAIGNLAGVTRQGTGAIALGDNAGYANQGTNSVSIGKEAGNTNQGANSIAIGYQAGQNAIGGQGVAIGYQTANNQSTGAVAIGYSAGANQGTQSVAIGYQSAYNGQGQFAVSMGYRAGYDFQTQNGIAIGYQAGQTLQGSSSIAIGKDAGRGTQGVSAVAIGDQAGSGKQGNYTVAIGYRAGWTGQGANSIAIGNMAGQLNQANNSIIINADGGQLNGSQAGLYIRPIRQDNTVIDNPLVYATSGEVVQSNAIKVYSMTGYSSCFYDSEVINKLTAPSITGANCWFGGKVTAAQFTGSTGVFDTIACGGYTGTNVFYSGIMTGSSGAFSNISTTNITGSTGFFGSSQINGVDTLSRFYVKAPDAGDYRVPASFYRTTTSDVSTLIRCHSDWGATNREVFRVNSNGNCLNWNSSYGSISDVRLKEDITDCRSQIEDIKNLKIRRYKLKGTDEYQIGVIAQELLETSPNLVSPPCEGLDYYSVKYSVLYTKAIKALQEVIARVESLEAKINSNIL